MSQEERFADIRRLRETLHDMAHDLEEAQKEYLALTGLALDWHCPTCGSVVAHHPRGGATVTCENGHESQ